MWVVVGAVAEHREEHIGSSSREAEEGSSNGRSAVCYRRRRWPGPHAGPAAGRRGRRRRGRPIPLSARARLLATGGDRKTDPADALHVVQVGLFRTDLRKVTPEDQSTILRLLTERHNDLVNERTRITNRLHAVLRELLPGGAPTGLSADKAAALMKGIRPITATDNCRRDIARDLLADLRRLDRQVKENEAHCLRYGST